MTSKQSATSQCGSGIGRAARTVAAKAIVDRDATAPKQEQVATEASRAVSRNTSRVHDLAPALAMCLSATTGFIHPPGKDSASTVVRLNYSITEACAALGCGRTPDRYRD